MLLSLRVHCLHCHLAQQLLQVLGGHRSSTFRCSLFLGLLLSALACLLRVDNVFGVRVGFAHFLGGFAGALVWFGGQLFLPSLLCLCLCRGSLSWPGKLILILSHFQVNIHGHVAVGCGQSRAINFDKLVGGAS